MDWYKGNVVYSGGFMNWQDAGGFAHFGHAVFVDDRNNKTHIAHEMRHALQMEKRGNRMGYYWTYLEQNGWGIDYEAPKYAENEYELDAYYTEYLYDEGFVDIYGKSKNGSIDHDSYARKTGF